MQNDLKGKVELFKKSNLKTAKKLRMIYLTFFSLRMKLMASVQALDQQLRISFSNKEIKLCKQEDRRNMETLFFPSDFGCDNGPFHFSTNVSENRRLSLEVNQRAMR